MLRWNLASVFWAESLRRSCVQRWPKLYLDLVAQSVRVTGWYWFWRPEGVMESWAWHCERPGEVIGKNAASVAIKGSGLKASCKEVEAWHHEKSQWEALGKKAAQLPQTTPVLWRCWYNGRATKNSSSSSSAVEPAWVWKTSCACCRGWSWRSDPSPLEEPRRLWVNPRILQLRDFKLLKKRFWGFTENLDFKRLDIFKETIYSMFEMVRLGFF